MARELKAWFDAVTALAKPVSLLFTVVLAAWVLHAVKSNAGLRPLKIDIDSKTEALLPQLGAQLDMRAALVSDTNRQIEFASEVVNANAFKNVVNTKGDDTKGEADLSLKPFGLDTSMGDLLKLLRMLEGAPPPPSVRIEAVCLPAGCDPSRGDAGPKVREVNLRIELSDGQSPSEPLIFHLPAGPGMRRALHQALASASERLVELTDPLLASVWYLNQGTFSPFVASVDDEMRRYLERSVGASVRVLRDEPGRVCLAQIVAACSEITRAMWQDDGSSAQRHAMEALDSIAKAPQASWTCRMWAETDIALFMFWTQFCPADPLDGADERNRFAPIGDALDTLNDHPRARAGALDPEWDRVDAIRLELDILKAFSGQIDDQARARACARVARPTAPDRTFAPRTVLDLLAQIKKTFPPGPSMPVQRGAVLDLLGSLVDSAAPPGDAYLRMTVSEPLMKALDSHIATDIHPRSRFMTKGNLLFSLARAAVATDASSAQKDRFTEELGLKGGSATESVQQAREQFAKLIFAAAAISYENASATTGWPSEAGSDLEPLMRLGDTRYAAGDTDGAQRAYARAVTSFIDREEPTREIIGLANVASHWATLLIRGGLCSKPPGRDATWSHVWRALGARPDDDLCTLLPPVPSPGRSRPVPTTTPLAVSDGTHESGVIDIVREPVETLVRACAQGSGPVVPLTVLDCLKRNDSRELWNKFLATHPSVAIDERIAEALVAADQ
ncbi:MAG: hypothetical protein ACHQ53_04240 [Polyangiales bacterium]